MRHLYSRSRGAKHGRDRLAPRAGARTAAAAHRVHNPHPCHRRARGSDVRQEVRAVIALCAQDSSHLHHTHTVDACGTRGHACIASGTRLRHRPHASDMQGALVLTLSQRGVPVSVCLRAATRRSLARLVSGRSKPRRSFNGQYRVLTCAARRRSGARPLPHAASARVFARRLPILSREQTLWIVCLWNASGRRDVCGDESAGR